MVKSELIQRIAAKQRSLGHRDVELAVGYILEHLAQNLCQNHRIEIRGFGSFSLHFRAPRRAHNPKTGERVITEPKYTPHFKPGKDLKIRINDSRQTYPLIHTPDEE